MNELMQSAVEAARIGGEILLEGRRTRPAVIDSKSANDFVTDVDRRSEGAIVAFLRDRHPDHAILAEEGSDHDGGSGYRWIIDPLDGTTNYIHDYPCFAVSVGLWHGEEAIAAAVLDPVRGELFHAAKGSGAWLGDDPIRVSDASTLSGALLVTGFPFRQIHRIDEYLRTFRELFVSSAGVRRDGSAALDLCSVAAGRLDGFWELGLAPWDLAAGTLIVQEAGGTVSDYLGEPGYMTSGDIIAAPAGLHREMLAVLRPARDPA